MRFFCPQCHSPMTASGGISHVICSSCGLEINLELVDTSAGRGQLKLTIDHTGTQLGPYRLNRCLGTGGMGSVYRATDTRDDREVAVKVLYPQLAALPHLLARFHREAQALQKLQDEHIVKFIEAGEAQGHHFIVMQYVAGEDLGRRLARQQPDIPTALAIGQKVAEALAVAHARGVVHRDLKPANVIVTPAGAVRVLDFGIAQFATTDHTLTHSDAVLGTFNYMAPEQRAGAKTADHRSDLYALGVMLYQMTTGTLPIGALQPPRRLNGQINRDLQRLLLRLLQNDPDQRPQTAAEVVATLRTLRQPPAVPPSVWAAAAVLVLATGAGAVYAWTRTSSPAKLAATPHSPSPPSVTSRPANPLADGDRSATQAGPTTPETQRLSASAANATPLADAGPDTGQPPAVSGKLATARSADLESPSVKSAGNPSPGKTRRKTSRPTKDELVRMRAKRELARRAKRRTLKKRAKRGEPRKRASSGKTLGTDATAPPPLQTQAQNKQAAPPTPPPNRSDKATAK